ncbi:MAG: hypothetical protein Q4C84_10310 [Bacillota bacterium]|nr:hypothetical protein [Bacillota bacterium]
MIKGPLDYTQNPHERHLMGVFIPLEWLKLRLVTDYFFLSNHLQIRWQITPAIIERINDKRISIEHTPFLIPVWGGNIKMISYPKVQNNIAIC